MSYPPEDSKIPYISCTDPEAFERSAASDLSDEFAEEAHGFLFGGTGYTSIGYLAKGYELHARFQSLLKPVCQVGCSACCNIPVDVTELEAIYISQNTGIELIASKNSQTSNIGPCPFLVDHKCSIHPYRPLACRAFLTFDSPKYCQGAADQIHVVSRIDSEPFAQTFHERVVLMSPEVRDIREWFK